MRKVLSFCIFLFACFSLISASDDFNPKEFSDGYFKNVLLPTGFETLGERDFDTAPTPFSTDAMEKLKDAREQILDVYKRHGGGRGLDYATRNKIDSIMATALDKPLEEVKKNHSLYVRIITGANLEDKSFWKAFDDSLKSFRVQKEIDVLEKNQKNLTILLKKELLKWI